MKLILQAEILAFLNMSQQYSYKSGATKRKERDKRDKDFAKCQKSLGDFFKKPRLDPLSTSSLSSSSPNASASCSSNEAAQEQEQGGFEGHLRALPPINADAMRQEQEDDLVVDQLEGKLFVK